MTFQDISGSRAVRNLADASRFAARETGGPYGWLTPYIASLAAHNEAIRARVLAIPRAELHFIALCVSLMGAKRDDADHFAAFARSYGVISRRVQLAIAAELGGAEACPALAKAAPKFAGGVWRPATYLRLAALMNDAQARKTLAHLSAITRGKVIVLARLPAGYRTSGVLKMIRRRRDVSEVVFAIELVRRIRTDLTDRQIIASLEKAESDYIREWVMRHYERVPFPAAPTGELVLGGVDALHPLASYEDLARAAREFDNCIRDYLWRVLRGDSYFYRYAPEAGGKGVAIVELRRAPVVGWVVHEALGPENERIKGADRAAILAAFRGAGIGAAPQAANPNAWFDLS